MFINLLKHSLRSFKRQRSYIIINITGLSIGIACSLLIGLDLLYETSFDGFNAKKDRIFDIAMNFKLGDQEFTEATSAYPVGPALLREVPEVEDFLRMRKTEDGTVRYNNETYDEENIIMADSSFFNFFTIPVLKGDPGTLLNAPRQAVLSRSLSKKIFGNENPVEKILKIGKDTTTYIVTGVMSDIPGNSHFKAGMLVSMLSDPQANSQEWGSNNLCTYLLLKPNASYKNVDEKLAGMVAKYMGPDIQRYMNISFEEFLSRGNRYGYSLQKLSEIHLDTRIKPFFLAPGDPKLLKILGCIALLILLVAVVNFTNLSTAQAAARAKEVVIKKLGGSTRGMLITQFLTESILMSFISTILALIIIRMALPFFNYLLGTSLILNLITPWFMVPIIILFAVVTGILAGSYPAFFMSSFSPYRVLKGSSNNSNKGRLRKVLVVLQFTISIFLVAGTMIMYRQIVFMIDRDPGFIKDQLLVLENEEALGTNAKSFKELISTIPGVVSVTSSTAVPGYNNNNTGYMVEGKKDEPILMWTNYVDYKFLETYSMKLKSGRFFSKEFLADDQVCILNESAIKKFNIDPGKLRIMGYRDSGKVVYYPIIGVVKDFLFESQRNQIAPLIFRLKSESYSYGYITAKISPKYHRETIKKIEAAWKEFVTGDPLSYHFIDDIMMKLYIKERQNALIAVISAILAIFIAALGLYGLTSYTVVQRTKEIGVRKAMGSSVPGIYFNIAREIIILVSVSALLSFPLIYYISHKWLENFYYRISPGFLTLLGGFVIAMGIAVLTISYHTLRAARVNPAQSLRYE